MTRNANPTVVVLVLIAVSLMASMPLGAASSSEPAQKETREETRTPVTGQLLERHRNLVEISLSPGQIRRLSIETSEIGSIDPLEALQKAKLEAREIIRRGERKGFLPPPKDRDVLFALEGIRESLSRLDDGVNWLRRYTIELEFNAPIYGIQAVTHAAYSYDDAKAILADVKSGAIKTVSAFTEVGSGIDSQSGKPTTWQPCRKCMIVTFGY